MKKLIVKANFDEPPDSAWLHRFQNFGEDVWRALKNETDVSLDEIDRSATSFEVRGLKAKRVGRAKKTLRCLLDRHCLANDVLVEEVRETRVDDEN